MSGGRKGRENVNVYFGITEFLRELVRKLLLFECSTVLQFFSLAFVRWRRFKSPHVKKFCIEALLWHWKWRCELLCCSTALLIMLFTVKLHCCNAGLKLGFLNDSLFPWADEILIARKNLFRQGSNSSFFKCVLLNKCLRPLCHTAKGPYT